MKRLLLVDDHAAVRGGLRLMLESAGWAVDEAETIEQVWNRLSSVRYRLLVLDVTLGEENGLELARRLRLKYSSLPLLVLSMHSDALTVRAALRAGVHGYVLKQASPEELLNAVEAVSYGAFHMDARVAPLLMADLKQAQESSVDSQLFRRKKILAALQKGHNNQEIADQLNLSVSSVKAHLRDLFAEFGVKDRLSLLMAAREEMKD